MAGTQRLILTDSLLLPVGLFKDYAGSPPPFVYALEKHPPPQTRRAFIGAKHPPSLKMYPSFFADQSAGVEIILWFDNNRSDSDRKELILSYDIYFLSLTNETHKTSPMTLLREYDYRLIYRPMFKRLNSIHASRKNAY
jgi:hypothetical protein